VRGTRTPICAWIKAIAAAHCAGVAGVVQFRRIHVESGRIGNLRRGDFVQARKIAFHHFEVAEKE
jgi:hypothetical protein